MVRKINIIRILTLCCFTVLSLGTLNAQTTLFSETFDEAAGAVTGISAEGVNWSATCPGCLANDVFEVTATGGFQGNDTNGPATFAATGIDATGCFLVTYAFDFNATEYDGGDGVGEAECASDCAGCSGLPADASSGGCNNCWDYLYAELDLGASSDAVVLLGVDCDIPNIGNTTSAPSCASPYDANGDLIPGNDASNITLNLVVSNWAAAEQITFDNIIVTCYTETEATTAGLVVPAGCNAPPPPVAVANDCACANAPTPFTINTQADNLSQAGYTLTYALDNGGTLMTDTPAAASPASFTGLADNTAYTVCAFNVEDSELTAFQAALNAGSYADAQAMTGAFAGFCYEVACNVFAAEDCGCITCPVVTVPIATTEDLCDGETPILDEASLTLDDETLATPAGVGVTVSWWTDATFTTAFGGTVDYVTAGGDGCNTVDLTLYASIVCDATGNNIAAGTSVITVYPDYDVATVEINNGDCTLPTITSTCANYVVTGDAANITAAPVAGESGSNSYTITYNGGPAGTSCFSEVVPVTYNCPTAPDNTCDCDDAPTPYTINALAINNQTAYTLVYGMLDMNGTLLTDVPAAGVAASFPNLADNMAYEVCAFNVADAELADFQTALATAADYTDATDGTFVNPVTTLDFCYDVTCIQFEAEDCACPVCNITGAVVAETICDDNGTADTADDFFSFDLDVTQADATFTTFTFDGTALGLTANETGTYGTTYSSGNITIGALAGTTVTLTIIDDTDSDCSTTAEITIPAACSACPVITVNAQPVCGAVGGTFDIEYAVTGGIGPYTITESLGGTVLTNQAAVGTLTSLTYANQNDKVTLTIEDEGNPGCTTQYDVLQLFCGEQTACDCALDAANPYNIGVQAAGNGNGYSMVYSLVDATGNVVTTNQTGNFGLLADDGASYDVYAFNVEDSELAALETGLAVGTAIAGFDTDGEFNGLCYTVSAPSTFTEDCDCTTCPTVSAVLTGGASYCEVGTADIEIIFVNSDGAFAGTYDLVYSDGVNTFNVTAYNSGDAITVSPTATTTYTLVSATVTGDVSGCTISISGNAVVTVFDNPTIAFTSTNPTACGGTDGSVTITGLIAGVSYTVSADDASLAGTFVADAAGEIVLSTTLAAGAYNNVTVTDGNGCTSNAVSANLSDPNTPVVAIDPVATVCDTASVFMLTANPVGGVWSGDVDAAGNFDPSIGAGTYNVSYTYTNNGCTASDAVVIVVDACGVFDLALAKILTTAGPYAIGDTITFAIEVFNQGNIEGTNVEVTDYVPSELIFEPSLNTTWAGVAGDATPSTTITSIMPGMSQQVTIDLIIDASAASSGLIINNAEITAAFDDAGLVATDEDSVPGDDATKIGEINSDNDIDDDSIGGTDNPADSDDFDPAFFNITPIIDLVTEVCDCTGANGTISAAAEPGTFNILNTQIYVLVDANGMVVATSNDGIFANTPTGAYSIYALNYDPADAMVQTVLDNLVIGATFGLTVGVNENPCYDLSTAVEANINQCIPSIANIGNQNICAGEMFDLDALVVTEENGTTGSGVWTDVNGATVNGMQTVINGSQFTYTFTSVEGCFDSETITVLIDVLPAFTLSTTDATCIADGELVINIVAGNYEYSIDGETAVAITGTTTISLPADSYSVVITNTDTNCSASDSVTIGADATIPVVDVTAANPTCVNGASGANGLVTVNNPVTGVTYTITGGSFTDLTFGDYTITATNAAGCSDSTMVTLLEAIDCETQVISDLEACPCNGEDATLIAVAENGTFLTIDTIGNTYSQTYILVQGGVIIDIAINGTFAGLDSGTYDIYALNYQDNDAPTFTIGDAIAGLTNGTIAGCYDISAPAIGSINGAGCDCQFDCTDFADPSVEDITVCEGGATVIFPTDNTGSGSAGTAFTALWNFEGEVVTGSSDDATVIVADASVGLGIGVTSFPGGAGGSTDSYSGNGWDAADVAGAISNMEYFEYCVTAPASGDIIVSGLNFEQDASGSGPQGYAIYFNGIELATGATVEDFASPEITVFAEQVIGAGTTGCFQIYAFGASGSGGTLRFDDVTIIGEVGGTASGITFTYYDAATGGNVLGTGFSFDSATASGNSETIYVVASDGECFTNAIPVTITVNAPVNAGLDGTAFICDDSTDGEAILDLTSLLSANADLGGTWLDQLAMEVTNTEINFEGTLEGTYAYQYTLDANGACDADTATFVVTVVDCGFCAGFASPEPIDSISVCSDTEVVLTPVGGGISGNANLPFISELHYNNDGSPDTNEGVEISGLAGSLDCYQLYLYNGSSGFVYDQTSLVGLAIDDESNGYGAVAIPVLGIQNGPDAIALVDTCLNTVVDFISYGGTVEAFDGPAIGLLSTDILVTESNSNTSDESLELTENGWIAVGGGWDAELNVAGGTLNGGLLFTTNVAVTGYVFTDPSGNITTDVASLTATESGNYTITAVSNEFGCESEPITVNVDITEGPIFTIPAPCVFDIEEVVLDGPTGDYTYLWTDVEGNGLTNTEDYAPGVAGTYNLIVTDNTSDCSATQTVVVTEPIDISIPSQVACVGDIIALEAPMGYTYLWSTGETTSAINVTEFGAYTVTITDEANGCEITVTAFAIFNETPTVNAGEDVLACGGDTVVLTATSDDDDAEFVWSTGETTASITVSPNGSATYTVTVTNTTTVSGTEYTCTATDEVNVTTGDSPSAGANVAATICNNVDEGETTVSLFDLLENATLGGTFTDIGGNEAANDFSGVGLSPGAYTFTYTVGGSGTCPEDDATITINVEDCLVNGGPAILIVKDDADNQNDFQTIYSGGTATFTITVTNIGTEPLENIIITDPLSPNCDAVYEFDPLMPGDLFSYECTIDGVTEDFVNIVTVTATGTESGQDITDVDDTYVDVVLEPCPEIEIAGAGIAQYNVCAGEPVMLEVTVDNTNEDNITWSTGETGVTAILLEALENNTCDVMTMDVTAIIPVGAAYCTDATTVTFTINVLPNPNTAVELTTANDGCSVSLTACAGAEITHVVNGQTFTGATYTANAGESNQVNFYVENACGVSEAIVGNVSCGGNVCDTPITANAITECSEDGSTYTLLLAVSGGSGTYNVSGSLNETDVTAGVMVVGTFTDQSSYNFTIVDAAGVCPTVGISGVSESCAKGCDAIVLDVNNDCDSDTYSVIGSLLGGEAPYTVTINGTETQTVDEGFAFGPYNDATDYSLVIIDATGCELLYQGPTVQCGNVAIELLNFGGEIERNGNMLDWTTATENNNDYFTLERSFDGVNFEVITNVNGTGTSSSPSAYSFLDVDAREGNNFYRLKTTDTDGVTEIVSKVIKLVRNAGEATISVRPVPTSNTLYIDYNATVSNNVFVTIYDVAGRAVETFNTNVNGGDNTITLNIENYASGTYFITLQDANNVMNGKFIKK